ncbi:MAG: SAM-dependent methyltransferase, partial [Calditrichia bacterium]
RRYKFRQFENFQQFDFTGVKGRLLSSSYVPEQGHPNYDPMIRELRKIFRACQKNGVVKFEYDTKFYWGKLD